MEEKFLEQLTDVLDVEDTVAMDTVLVNLEEWDSLSIVSFIAMAKTMYGKTVAPASVKAAITVKDLYQFVQD